MSDIKKTAKYAAIYAIGVFLNKMVSIIMLPIYTRFLTPKDYGTIELLTMTTDVFGMLVGLGITTAIFRYYYKYETDEERKKIISTATMLLIAFYLMASNVGYFLSSPLSELILDGSKEANFYFKLIFTIFFFQSFIEVPLVFIKAQQRPYFFVIINTSKLIVQISLNIYFIVFLKMHVLGVLYSTLISFVIFGSILIVYTFKTVGFKFTYDIAVSMIKFGAPFIITNICDFVLTFSDRYFLKAYTSLTTVGIYSLGYKLGFVLWAFAVMPFMNIWGPQRFEIVKNENNKIINHKVFFAFNLFVISIALLLSLFSQDLFRIMSASTFWEAYKIVPLIMLAYILQAWTSFVNFGVLYTEKTIYIAIGTLSAAIVIVVFSFFLIPKYGMNGAALATIFAFTIRFAIIFYYSQKLHPLSLPWTKILLMMIISAVIYIISLFVDSKNLAFSIIVNTVLFLSFLLSLIVSPVFNRDEKRIIISVIRRPIKSLKSGGILS